MARADREGRRAPLEGKTPKDPSPFLIIAMPPTTPITRLTPALVGLLTLTSATLGQAGADRPAHVPAPPAPHAPGYQTLAITRAPAPGASQAGSISGTDQDPRVLPVTGLERQGGLHVGQQDSTLWIRGETYKASASAAGFTYIPFLGSRASRNWPVTFRLAGAEFSGEARSLEAGQPRLETETIVIDRGPVEARYHLGTRAVEQTFAFPKEAAMGPVNLRIEVETDLEIQPAANGLLFLGPDGGVTFGAAMVVDSVGLSRSLPLDWDGTSLHYTIPGDYVAAATGEIVLDPLIATTVVDDFGLELTRPDVAFDADTNAFCVLYEESFSTTDGDLYYKVIDGTTFSTINEGYMEVSSLRAYDPHIATIAASNRFVAVFTQEDAFARPAIHMRSAVSGATVSFGPDFTIVDTNEFFFYLHPDVGGEAYEGSASTYAAVVFEEQPRGAGNFASGIRVRLVDRDGTPLPGLINIVPSLSAKSQERPVISKFTGDSNNHGAWWIASLTGTPGSPADEIRTTRMRFSGLITEDNATTWGPWPTQQVDHLEISSPHDGALDEALSLVFDCTTAGETDTMLVTRARTGLGPTLAAWQTHQKIVEIDTPKERGSFATNRDRAVVTYFDKVTPATPYELRSSTLELTTNLSAGVGERRTRTGALNQALPTSKAQAASKTSGGENVPSTQVFLVWADRTTGATSNIVGALLNLNAPPVAASTWCRSGYNSTGDFSFLACYGDNGLASNKEMLVTSLPAHSLGYFLTSDFSSVSHPPGSQGNLCMGGSIGRYAGNVLNSGPAGRVTFTVNPTALASPTGSMPAMAGERHHFQYWYRDQNPTSTSNFTNAVTIRF